MTPTDGHSVRSEDDVIDLAGDPGDGLPTRDVHEDLADPLDRLSESLSRVADEIGRSSKTIAETKKSAAKKKALKNQPAPVEPAPAEAVAPVEPAPAEAVAPVLVSPPAMFEAPMPVFEAPAVVQAQEPELVASRVVEPEVAVAEVVEPEIVEPEVVEPAPVEPEVVEPEVVEARVVIASQGVEPTELAQPDLIEPIETKPETKPEPKPEPRSEEIPVFPPVREERFEQRPVEPSSEGAPDLTEFVFAQNRTQEPSTPAASIASMTQPLAMHANLGPRNLSRSKYETVRVLIDALLPNGGDLPISGAEAGVVDRFDAMYGKLDKDVQARIAKFIALIDKAPLATKGRRFSKLSPDKAVRWVDSALRARTPSIRTAITTLKSLIANEFASTPDVERWLGYTYSCETKDPPRDAGTLEVITFPMITRDHVEECDVVVVGSGAGGSAVAKELSESGLSVIVLEEGAYFSRNDFAGPPSERVRRMYRSNGMFVTKGAPSMPLLMGKAVGGTTLVNAGTCFRTPDHVLRRWENEAGIEGIDPVSMRPIFERVQRTLHVQPVPEDVLGSNAQIFRRGTQELGLHGLPISRNISGCRGCGVCTFGCPSDAKQSTNISYLPRAQRAGATIYARCAVRHILVHDGRTRGVVAELRDEHGIPRANLTVHARMVVVSAGAVHTPALLQANALANRSGMLGANLHLNPSASVSAIFEEEITSWRGTMQPYFVDDFHSIDESMIEVTSIVPSTAAGSWPGAGHQLKGLLARLPNVASANVFVSDSSTGHVTARGRSEPAITYKLNEHDAHTMSLGISRVAEVFLAAGARVVYTGVASFPWIRSQPELQAFRENETRPSELTLSACNPAGTARMGSDPATSVVDGWGECHDVEGLFVADAAMLPGCPTVNPQITIMAFATRTAAHIVRDRAAALA